MIVNRDIIWSLEAEENFNQNIDYLLEYWGTQSANDFLFEFDKTIEMIFDHPKIGTFDNKWDCYKTLVVKQITLYYNFDGNKLMLVNVWNNKKEPL